MQARIVPAARGAAWLSEGWRVFRTAPLAWLALIFAYVIITQVIAIVPLAGPALAAVLVPPFTVGFMAAARAGSRGAPVELAMLFEAFRTRPRPQVALGAVYAVCIVAVFGGATLAVGPDVLRAAAADEMPDEERVRQVLSLAAVLMALYAPVMMMFWFAPPLSAWHAVAPTKALFFSAAACLMNWRAFIAYGTVAALAVLALPFLVLSGLVLASGGALQVPAMSLVFPLLIVLLPTLLASFYVSYRDVFAGGEP
jgi:hypothetical protein